MNSQDNARDKKSAEDDELGTLLQWLSSGAPPGANASAASAAASSSLHRPDSRGHNATMLSHDSNSSDVVGATPSAVAAIPCSMPAISAPSPDTTLTQIESTQDGNPRQNFDYWPAPVVATQCSSSIPLPSDPFFIPCPVPPRQPVGQPPPPLPQQQQTHQLQQHCQHHQSQPVQHQVLSAQQMIFRMLQYRAVGQREVMAALTLQAPPVLDAGIVRQSSTFGQYLTVWPPLPYSVHAAMPNELGVAAMLPLPSGTSQISSNSSSSCLDGQRDCHHAVFQVNTPIMGHQVRLEYLVTNSGQLQSQLLPMSATNVATRTTSQHDFIHPAEGATGPRQIDQQRGITDGNSVTAAGDALSNQGRLLQRFPNKLHALLCQTAGEGKDYIVSWTGGGTAFKVHDKKRFLSDIAPLHFRQKNMASFRRQLSMYGFDRIATGPNEGSYEHALFHRDHPEWADQMIRVKAQQQAMYKSAPKPPLQQK